MDFLNHLVAARLMTDAKRFERIERFGHQIRLLGYATAQPRPLSSCDGELKAERLSRPALAPSGATCEHA